MLQADRVLALASTQVKLYRDEFLTQAVWAISVDRLDDAEKLYTAAMKVDPSDKEAVSGAAMVAKMKAGKLTKAELTKRVAAKTGAAKVDAEGIRAVVQDPARSSTRRLRRPEVDAPAPAGQPRRRGRPARGGRAPPADRGAAVQGAGRRDHPPRAAVAPDRPGRRVPGLKRQRDDILGYDAIGDDARRQMVADLEAVMREVFVKGAEIKRQADAERQRSPGPGSGSTSSTAPRTRSPATRTASTSSAN